MSYEVEPATLGAAGRSVRCVRCQNVWFAEVPALEGVASGPSAAFGAPEEPAFSQDDIAAGTEVWSVPEPELPPGSESLDAVEQAIAEAERVVAETVDQPVDHRGPADMIQSPPLVPPQEGEPSAEAEQVDTLAEDAPLPHGGHDIETVVSRRARKIMMRKRTRPSLKMPAIILGLLTVVVSLVLWRKDIVRLAPQTASLYSAIGLKVNLRGLTFANIKTIKEVQEGVPVLVVEGQIVAEGRQAVEVPRLRFAIRNASGYEIYSWTTIAGRTVLAPGEAIDFRSRLASPPADGRDVAVRFFNRRDMLTGMR
jgi:predicted Zn finger-like uncharacterized protein